MNSLVEAVPEVFSRGLQVFQPAIPILETHVQPYLVGHWDHVLIYLMCLFCGTGVMKLLMPGPLVQMWKYLPAWSWTAAALVEFVSSYFFYQGQLDIGIPLYYTFLGAVSCAVCSQLSTLYIAPFPLSTVALIWCYGKEYGVDSSSWVVPCMATGAVVTLLVGSMKSSGSDKKVKKR